MNLYLTYTYKLVKSLSPSEKGYVKKYFNNQTRRESSFIEFINYLDSIENINVLKSNESDVLVKYTKHQVAKMSLFFLIAFKGL